MSGVEERITVASLLDSGAVEHSMGLVLYSQENGPAGAGGGAAALYIDEEDVSDDELDGTIDEQVGQDYQEHRHQDHHDILPKSIEKYRESDLPIDRLEHDLFHSDLVYTQPEIECHIIKKSVFIDGVMESVDFIMCNECPRLFRTENLLWNHIKAKHGTRRRAYQANKSYYNKRGKQAKNSFEESLEPGEIVPRLSNLVDNEQEEGGFKLADETQGRGANLSANDFRNADKMDADSPYDFLTVNEDETGHNIVLLTGDMNQKSLESQFPSTHEANLSRAKSSRKLNNERSVFGKLASYVEADLRGELSEEDGQQAFSVHDGDVCQPHFLAPHAFSEKSRLQSPPSVKRGSGGNRVGIKDTTTKYQHQPYSRQHAEMGDKQTQHPLTEMSDNEWSSGIPSLPTAAGVRLASPSVDARLKSAAQNSRDAAGTMKRHNVPVDKELRDHSLDRGSAADYQFSSEFTSKEGSTGFEDSSTIGQMTTKKTDNMMYLCLYCSNSPAFKNKIQLKRHMLMLHGKKLQEDQVCPVCHANVRDLFRHLEVSHRKLREYDCDHCDLKFCTQEDLDRHLWNEEKKNNGTHDKKSKSNKRSEENIALELPEFNFMKVDDEPPSSMLLKESKLYRCYDCGTATHSRMTYIHHVLSQCSANETPSVISSVKENKSSQSNKTPRKRKRGRPPRQSWDSSQLIEKSVFVNQDDSHQDATTCAKMTTTKLDKDHSPSSGKMFVVELKKDEDSSMYIMNDTRENVNHETGDTVILTTLTSMEKKCRRTSGGEPRISIEEKRLRVEEDAVALSANGRHLDIGDDDADLSSEKDVDAECGNFISSDLDQIAANSGQAFGQTHDLIRDDLENQQHQQPGNSLRDRTEGAFDHDRMVDFNSPHAGQNPESVDTELNDKNPPESDVSEEDSTCYAAVISGTSFRTDGKSDVNMSLPNFGGDILCAEPKISLPPTDPHSSDTIVSVLQQPNQPS